MTTWTYPAVFREETPGDWVVSFPDVPEAITGADSLDAARLQAADAIEEAVLAYLADGRPAPRPRPARTGEEAVVLDPVTAARAALADAMAQQQVTNADLARRLGQTEGAVRRLVRGDRRGGLKIDTVLQALSALGGQAALVTSEM